MKRAPQLPLVVLLAVAAGCSSTRRCVNDAQQEVDESLCAQDEREAAAAEAAADADGGAVSNNVAYVSHYPYWYGGYVWGGRVRGGSVSYRSSGGSFSSGSSAHATGVSRGGFGATGAAHASGGE